MKFDFEEIAEKFQNYFKIKSVSHCDEVETNNNEIFMIEKTVYIDKNLLNENIYKSEIVETVKKMWGSFAISVWYWHENPKMLSKKRIFVLRIKVSSRYERILSKFIKDLRKYKNGIYDDIKIHILK